MNKINTLPPNYMFWDKDLCKYATADDVAKFVKIEPNIYGTDYEMRLQCFGRFRRLAYTGMDDKHKKPIYEGYIVKAVWKLDGKKIVMIGAIGFEKAGFVIVDQDGTTASLSAYEPSELEIIGNLFQNPELLEVKHE